MKVLKMRTFLLACMICALFAVQASALEYSYGGAEDFLFARPKIGRASCRERV